MKKYFSLMLLAVVSTISCSEQDFSVDDLFEQAYHNLQNKKGIYQINENGYMEMYLRAYIANYYEQPKDVNFLIHAFDKLEDIEAMREVYAKQYQLMSKYKNDLKLYCTDSVTAIFYKNIKLSNILAITGYIEPEFDEFGRFRFDYLYFDKDGYVMENEELSVKYRKELYTIVQKYENKDWKVNDDHSPYYKPEYKMIIVQYTPTEGLINLDDNKRPIDVHSSPYFAEVEQWLKATCVENSYSKMIVSSRVPKNYNM